MTNVKQRKDGFYQDFLHTVTAVPEECTPQQIADETIYHRQKQRIKDYYPISYLQ